MDAYIKALRCLEFAGLYVFLPLAYTFDWLPLPVIPTLLLGTLYCGLAAWRDPDFPRGRFWRWDAWRKEQGFILGLLTINAAALTIVVWALRPAWLLQFALEEPTIWLLVLLLYPLLSVLPQEFIYRSFFFHRYGALFPSGRAADLASAMAFGFMHIVFENWVAVAMTTAGGWIFARTYRRAQSLLCVSIEHALYGCFVFTLGIGHYFYLPWQG